MDATQNNLPERPRESRTDSSLTKTIVNAVIAKGVATLLLGPSEWSGLIPDLLRWLF